MVSKSKGGPFFKLIDYHLRSLEYAFNAGDYANCISHMQSLGELLKTKLPGVPYIDVKRTPIIGGEASNNQRAWIIRSRPLISKGVRLWMDKHSRNNSFGLAFDEEDDDEEILAEGAKK